MPPMSITRRPPISSGPPSRPGCGTAGRPSVDVGPGNDWAVFRLGLPGAVESVEVDTRHFKGNSPGWVSVQVSEDGETWEEVGRPGRR